MTFEKIRTLGKRYIDEAYKNYDFITDKFCSEGVHNQADIEFKEKKEWASACITEIEQNYSVMQHRVIEAERKLREFKRKDEGGKYANWSSKG